MSEHILVPHTADELCAQRLRIHASDTAEVLMPVMSALHRRHCRVTAMSYAADDDRTSGHLEVRLQCPHPRLRSVPLWLANIVGVLRVEVLS